MNLAYSEKWFFARNQPIKPLATQEANDRHIEGLPYSAVIGGLDSPTHVVSVAQGWFSVDFFDKESRPYLNYDFKVLDDRIFLSMAIHRVYKKCTSRIAKSVTFSFSTNGEILMVEEGAGKAIEKETVASVAENWTDIPTFGDYTQLCATERRLPSST